MNLEELKIGDIVVVEYSWLNRPTVHYVVTEVRGYKCLCSFYGNVNCGDRPEGWLEANGELPDGVILVARPQSVHNAFSRRYDQYFEILYKREDANQFLD